MNNIFLDYLKDFIELINRSRKKGGSGLGLSIVKHIIEAHQEQKFVKSKLGIGTEFSFTIQKSNSKQIEQ